ncbi:MAG TPA: cytochrome c oxidase subunit II [Gaiellaceae bacterium]|nr:cytochrome c oxidase subunit II [Gaiellaceae bacterium]
MRRTAFATVGTTFVALVVAGIAYAGNGGFLPGEAHSPNAHRIDDAFIFVAIFTGIIFVIVEGALIAFIVKYRRGNRARTVEGPQIHGSTRLEIIWTVVPAVILAVIGAFVFYKLPGIADPPKAAAADETTIQIEGHQFYWLFRYPNGAISINRMVAPANEVVNEQVIGLDWDVNHSWWVPDLGGKYDAIPGRVNKTWFEAPVGDYVARCAELCGIQHALMDGTVHVVPRAQYDSFIAQRAANASSVAVGREEFQGACESCHRLDHAYVGPALAGNPLLANRKGIETLLRNGQGQMPAVGKNWTGAQIDALIAYTKRFVPKSGGAG